MDGNGYDSDLLLLEDGGLTGIGRSDDKKGSYDYCFHEYILSLECLKKHEMPSQFYFHRRVVFTAIANKALSLGIISKYEFDNWWSEIGDLDK